MSACRCVVRAMCHSPEKKWCHEDASRMMFDALLEENELYLAPEDSAFVKALIMGDPSMCL